MTGQDAIRDCIDFVGQRLNKESCEGERFLLVVWCDCGERPYYMGGNDSDPTRTLKMLKIAGDDIMTVQLDTKGAA